MIDRLGTLLLGFTSALLLASCASVLDQFKTGDPAATKAATPPPDHHPIFLTTVSPLPESMPNKTAVQITQIDTRQPGTTRLYVHLADSNGVYYQASKAQLEDLVCDVVEIVDGVETTVSDFTVTTIKETDPRKLAIAWVIDNSGSMGDTRARAVQKAVAEFATNKGPQDVFAGIRYDNKVVVEVPATTSTSSFTSSLKQDGLYGFGGMTAVIDASAKGVELLQTNAAEYSDRAVVVFTDGKENSSKMKVDQLVDQSLAANVPIVAVDFGANVNEGFMKSIATSTGGFYQHIYRTDEFNLLFDDIYRRLRNAYVIEYPTTSFGDHEVRIKLCVGDSTVADTSTYNNTPLIGAVALINVHFAVAKSTIRKESTKEIQHVANLMKAYPTMTIELRGHTDSTNSTGDENYNLTLSQNRADAVRTSLIGMGIDESRITAKGLGDTVPVATNTTPEGRQRNRRTEFVILTR